MNKCYVTELQCSIENPNLPYYGGLEFSVTNINAEDYTIRLGKTQDGNCTLTTLNSQLYDDLQIQVGTTPPQVDTITIGVQNGLKLLVKDKYNITLFNVNSYLGNDFDISSLLHCDNLVYICLTTQRHNPTGDIKRFFDNFAELHPNRQATLKISVSGGAFTNIPTGVGDAWNNLGEIFFDSNYTDGWYIKASDGTYYDSEGNVITP